jgi:hypothetical protein
MKLQMLRSSKALFHNNIHVESIGCRESRSIEAHLEQFTAICYTFRFVKKLP